ncbi:MAG: chaperone modulator CbpM [Bacteroidota bacterium]
MEMQEYIPIDLFCKQHGIEVTVISSLHEYGLIELIQIDESEYLLNKQLADAEKIVRLYSDLNINPEGIDVILNLLQTIKEMQSQIGFFKNRLNIYEESDI